jgi:hypothetical protein
VRNERAGQEAAIVAGLLIPARSRLAPIGLGICQLGEHSAVE